MSNRSFAIIYCYFFFIKCYQFLQSLFVIGESVLVFKLLITQKYISTTWNSDMAQCQSAKGQFWIFVTSLWQQERGTKYRGTENCKRQRIPNGIVPSRSYKGLMCENPKFIFVCSEKRHFQGLDMIRDGNIQCANSICRFFAVYRGVPMCCDDQGSNSMNQEVWNISVWSYFTSGFEVDWTSKSGWCFKKYFFGTSLWAQESAFKLYKQKTLLKFFRFICFR